MNKFATITERSTLTFVRNLPGPIERAWAYLTDPAFLVKWFSDGTVADFVGGEVKFDMGATGRITAYEPPHLLEYTWNEEDAAIGPVVNSLLRWELSPEGSGVRLTLTHSRLPEGEVFGHGAGWHAFLDRMTASVEGREAEPFEKLYARAKREYIPVVQSAGITHVS
ncbi:MAG: SRPBCC family protein [Candidatus Eremiobacteraeota bacterium]|nr:SRPBCC family protein [Candidatus Eremiobacteraeota bacterium]MBV8222716.1 SRPBCC family protein [Candidatus Eremiobacteraeota bacterium]MBV8281368.1 SRPBCC family protein [Candidatus Eremiobacteraeota bacterium]